MIGAVITLGGVGTFLLIRLLATPEPTPTPNDVIGPSPTTRPGASSSPSPVKPTPTPEALPTTPAPVASPTAPLLNLSDLQWFMLTLINEDRAATGLEPVVWDQAAGLAAQSHAEEMARFGYLSHWNLDGHGPHYRYSQAGGFDAAQENVYSFWYRYDDERPAPIENWEAVVRQAQAELMSSPGHRENILTPEHTHVGIGIAYKPESGDVRLAQLFVNRYVRLLAIPIQASRRSVENPRSRKKSASNSASVSGRSRKSRLTNADVLPSFRCSSHGHTGAHFRLGFSFTRFATKPDFSPW